MDADTFLQNIIDDIGVDLLNAYDKNFQRKRFFNKRWKPAKLPNSRGSLMLRSGKLRRSIRRRKGRKELSFTSSVPYALLMNEGGEIVVTEKMKRFFWAMYKKAVQASGGASKNKVQRLSSEALKWKRLALQKVGSKMKVEQRQFLGWHPRVDQIIKDNVDYHLRELNHEFTKKLRQK